MIYLLTFPRGTSISKERECLLKEKLLQDALVREYQMKDAVLRHSREGQPYLENHPEIHLSFTRTEGLLGLALAPWPVGLDAETRKPLDSFVARKILGSGERASLGDSKDPEGDLLRYFTLKEAYGKAMGTGLSYEFRKTGFSFQGEHITSPLPCCRFFFIRNCEEIIISCCQLTTGSTGELMPLVAYTFPQEG